MAENAPWEKYQSMGPASESKPWEKYSTPQENPQADKLSWAQVPGEALSNIPSSAAQFAKNTVQPILHPMETVRNIGRAGRGALERAGVVEDKGYGKYADQVWEGLKGRYGGEEQFKNTLATDPVGAIADLSMLFTAGETALARAPGIAGKVGEVAGTAAKVTNPVNMVVKGAALAPKVASQVAGNVAGGHGAAALEEAYRTGTTRKTAPSEGQTFREGMRTPEVVQQGLVTRFKDALNQIELEKSAEYQKGMQAVGQIQKPLDFTEIDSALNSVSDVGKFQGHDVAKLAGESKPTEAQAMHAEIKKNIESWKKLPNIFHTPAGFDALKRLIGDKVDWKTKPDAANKVAKTVYHAIRDTIAKQDPNYAKVMKKYQQASDMIDEITRTLSLGKKATEDTALRKILSTTRSNVNTNFGKRLDLAKELNKKDPTLLPSAAGVSSSTWTPQGLVGKGALLGGGGLAAFLHNPALLAALPATSPRLTSEIAHGAGRAASYLPKLPPGLENLLKSNPQLLQKLLLATQQAGKANGQTSPQQ